MLARFVFSYGPVSGSDTQARPVAGAVVFNNLETIQLLCNATRGATSMSKSTQIDVGKKVVVATRSVKENKKATTAEEVRWALDFSKCTETQILELASRPVVIGQQDIWRKSSPKAREGMKVLTIDVAETLSGRKPRKSKAEKAMDQVKAAKQAGLTDEQRQELLELLGG
jgi:hypothetical protein